MADNRQIKSMLLSVDRQLEQIVVSGQSVFALAIARNELKRAFDMLQDLQDSDREEDRNG